MAKKRLLVIEDDVDVAEMLVVYFSGQGYDVLNAQSGGEGIAMARGRFPNLILLDVMLPDMDGFDVCKSLRNTTLTKYIPITFLTQRDARADKVAGLELGADDYVTKPFDMDELRLRVQGSIRRSSREALSDIRTGLPTSALINDLRQTFYGRPGFSEITIELAGLNAFRDVYGFVASDEALAFTGQVFSEMISKNGTVDDFAGMLAEDKYIIFTFVPDPTAFIELLKTQFSTGIKTLYNFLDIDRGFVLLRQGTPEEEQVPLMHLVINYTAPQPTQSTPPVAPVITTAPVETEMPVTSAPAEIPPSPAISEPVPPVAINPTPSTDPTPSVSQS